MFSYNSACDLWNHLPPRTMFTHCLYIAREEQKVRRGANSRVVRGGRKLIMLEEKKLPVLYFLLSIPSSFSLSYAGLFNTPL